MIAWLTRSALATASMPAIRQLAVQRKPSGWVALTLYWPVGGRPRAPFSSTRLSPTWVSCTWVKSQTTSGSR